MRSFVNVQFSDHFIVEVWVPMSAKSALALAHTKNKKYILTARRDFCHQSRSSFSAMARKRKKVTDDATASPFETVAETDSEDEETSPFETVGETDFEVDSMTDALAELPPP
jgi:hypothetical protein